MSDYARTLRERKSDFDLLPEFLRFEYDCMALFFLCIFAKYL